MFYLALLPICYLIFIASVQSINLINADLGRHITNGKLISGALARGLDLRDYTPLFANFYSYTEPTRTVINHHWLSGVLFHYLYESFGFNGLELINVFLLIAANLIFFFAARTQNNKNLALLILILCIPITCMRVEVRPESFSYLLMGIEFLLISLFLKNKISKKFLLISIPLLQFFWINLHLFFIYGLLVIGAYLLSFIINKNQENTKVFAQLLGYSIIASLLNPAHIFGLLEPLLIFKDYAYTIAENQSIFFMQAKFPNNPLDPYFEVLTLITLVSLFFNYKKSPKENWLTNALIIIPLIIIAFKVNRMMPVTAFYMIPILVESLGLHLTKIENIKTKKLIDLSIIISSIALIISFIYLVQFKFGRSPDQYKYNQSMDDSAKFVLLNNLPGPIFNNFDIGGYFIFHLFPRYRPFVDNRPEAYPSYFFKSIYLPMIKSEEAWLRYSEQYNLQTIYFAHNENDKDSEDFLMRRITDPNWAPIYLDEWTVVLIRRSEENQELIEAYELEPPART